MTWAGAPLLGFRLALQFVRLKISLWNLVTEDTFDVEPRWQF
jgi:hypothetical protein